MMKSVLEELDAECDVFFDRYVIGESEESAKRSDKELAGLFEKDGHKPMSKKDRKQFVRAYIEAKKTPTGCGKKFRTMVKGGMSPALAAYIAKGKGKKK